MQKYHIFRKNMVQCQLRTNNVRDENILKIFSEIPREIFVPESLKGAAYHDENLSLPGRRTMLSPVTHARLIQYSEPLPSDVVLDIGFGTGYGPSIWSSLVCTVIALEEKQELIDEAAANWRRLDICNVAAMKGSLSEGFPKHAPYDIIFTHGAVSNPPVRLFDQLAPGGRLMTILIKSGQTSGCAMKYYKGADGHVSALRLFEISAPYVPGYEPTPSFVF